MTNYQAIADYHWQNFGAGTNFMLVTGSSAILEGSVAYSKYNITLDDGSNDTKYSEIGGFNATMQITNFIGQNKVKYGLSIEGYNTDYQFVNSYHKRISQHEPSTNLSLFATYKWNAGKWLVKLAPMPAKCEGSTMTVEEAISFIRRAKSTPDIEAHIIFPDSLPLASINSP